MENKIHTGIIGFGLSGKVFHAPFIHTHPGFELSVVVERHRSHSKEIYPAVSVVKDYRELLDNNKIELIIIATPNTQHYPMAVECLSAGKHVVIEKPFTPTSAEADKLISLSEKLGKKIFVYHNRRWDGDFLTIKKLISQGVFGQISYYKAHFDRYNPELKAGAWRNEDIPGGGILYDLGSHLIDQALVLFGLPDAVKAEIRKEREGSRVDDAFHLQLAYADKTVVLRAGMLVKDPGPRYMIRGSHGKYSKPGIDPQEARLKAGEMPSSHDFGKEDPGYWGTLEQGQAPPFDMTRIPTENGNYMAFYDGVYACLRKNKPMPVLPFQARDVIFIIEKSFESKEKNQFIKIKQ